MLENVVDYDSDNEGQDNNRSDFDFLNPDLLDVAIENNGNNIDSYFKNWKYVRWFNAI